MFSPQSGFLLSNSVSHVQSLAVQAAPEDQVYSFGGARLRANFAQNLSNIRLPQSQYFTPTHCGTAETVQLLMTACGSVRNINTGIEIWACGSGKLPTTSVTSGNGWVLLSKGLINHSSCAVELASPVSSFCDVRSGVWVTVAITPCYLENTGYPLGEHSHLGRRSMASPYAMKLIQVDSHGSESNVARYFASNDWSAINGQGPVPSGSARGSAPDIGDIIFTIAGLIAPHPTLSDAPIRMPTVSSQELVTTALRSPVSSANIHMFAQKFTALGTRITRTVWDLSIGTTSAAVLIFSIWDTDPSSPGIPSTCLGSAAAQRTATYSSAAIPYDQVAGGVADGQPVWSDTGPGFTAVFSNMRVNSGGEYWGVVECLSGSVDGTTTGAMAFRNQGKTSAAALYNEPRASYNVRSGWVTSNSGSYPMTAFYSDADSGGLGGFDDSNPFFAKVRLFPTQNGREYPNAGPIREKFKP